MVYIGKLRAGKGVLVRKDERMDMSFRCSVDDQLAEQFPGGFGILEQ